MAEVKTRIFGTSFESFFKKPVLFREARCDVIAQKFLEALASYGLKPSQIVLKSGDIVFNYDMSVELFNGKGMFRLFSEKLDTDFENAAGNGDAEIIADCVAKVYEHVPLPEISHTNITANVHASFGSAEGVEKYLSRYANPANQIIRGGTIAHIRSSGWKQEIRLLVEQSIAFPEDVFLQWSTSLVAEKPSRDMLNKVGTAFVEAAAKLDLKFPRLEQK